MTGVAEKTEVVNREIAMCREWVLQQRVSSSGANAAVLQTS